MKAQYIFLLLFFSSLLLNSKCRKENNEPQLPPETTTGAMTFGCKIDGKVFVPKGSITSPSLVSNYYFLGNGPGGGWFLFVTGSNVVENPHRSVSIETDSLLLVEKNSYTLKRAKGFAYAFFLSDIYSFYMSPNDSGELYITKHDAVQRILSGRFSFTASRSTGEKVNITEGRFDVRY